MSTGTTRTASAPKHNVAVMASAGTGKTWLLITRLVRLLLAGAHPAGILAITFTRKAAAEMQARLRTRLYDYLTMSDAELLPHLEEIGIDTDAPSITRLRNLFETLLRSDQPVRVTTYHAFCQEVLRRFPFDAGVPPGFELLENDGLLAQEAWDALLTASSSAPDSDTAQALSQLLDYYGSVEGPRQALMAFLAHRIDWWAYTHNRRDPVAYAVKALTKKLAIDPQQDPATEFFSGEITAQLQDFHELLLRHQTATHLKYSDRLQQALDQARPLAERLAQLKGVFFTTQGKPVSRKENHTLAKKLGASGQARFLQIHHELCQQLAELDEQQRRRLTLRINRAWYTSGHALLGCYQNIKQERRLLDFADLEWHSYRLLRHSNQAQWVQYKLDRRIDHFLIDEFQDTNPTQWGMLLPLLEELAAGGDSSRQRSVFLVGDSKQSIYRFRRANPQLFATAGDWLQDHLQARYCSLATSRRSAAAIMDFVNQVFSAGPLACLSNFQAHDTCHRTLWGQVEMLPLVPAGEEVSPPNPTSLRNPLLSPRLEDQRRPHYQEGCQIAARIREILAAGPLLAGADGGRSASFQDIVILVRNRTHLPAYEQALRDAGIPYLGGGRTTLLDCLEIQDMVALLETLIAPYNNLSLATVLRSPLFACSDEELITLAQRAGSGDSTARPWYEALTDEAPGLAPDSALARARRLLEGWRSLVGHLPVHDLLDRIYCEAEVLQRYRQSFPAPLQPRSQANLIRFIELALEIDSGRYPSLPHFLQRIRALQQHDQDALEEAPALDHEGGVRLMTIHAAKGLEAPVVFLADATRGQPRRRAYQALINWPDDHDRPSEFILSGKAAELDTETQRLYDADAQEDRREAANLLYVALTRARQWLLISGCAPSRGNELGWYGAMAERLGETEEIGTQGYVLNTGEPPAPAAPPTPVTPAITTPPDPRLSQPLAFLSTSREIHPSHLMEPPQTANEQASRQGTDSPAADQDAITRGVLIHRMLDLLSREENPLPPSQLLGAMAAETSPEYEGMLESCCQEALQVVDHPQLSDLFNPACYQWAANEVPLIYRQDEHIVHGVIDRLVFTAKAVIIVDYKTHAQATAKNLASLAAPYHQQMQGYRQGGRQLWPDRLVRTGLLFTACATFYELTLDGP